MQRKKATSVKKRRNLVLTLLALSLLVGIPTGILMHERHHLQVNRVLVGAVEANQTNGALAALNAGAEADYPHKSDASRPLWLQSLDRILDKPTVGKEAEPSLLAQAVQNNNTVLVKALLDKGATDVNGLVRSLQDRSSPEEPISLLAAAAEAGNLTMCQALVAHGADVNLDATNCPLKMAAIRGKSDVLAFLLQHGAILDIPDGQDDYSLMGAAGSGDVESVRLLLAHGANAAYVGRFGSVLSAAVHGGNPAVVEVLVEAGADVNGGGAYSSVLQEAADIGDLEIVRYLLKKGAKVNEEVRWNRTPLLIAVKQNHTAVVKLLLAYGADWRPKVEEDGMDFAQGDTALHLAQSAENSEIIQMLRKAGAVY
jgi:ankyrin repeat protein